MDKSVFSRVKNASRKLSLITDDQTKKVLQDLAEITRANKEQLLKENQKDLDRMSPDDPKFDRLKLTGQRIEDIIGDMLNVAGLPSPLGRTLDQKTLSNGMKLSRITVPLGVIGMIYEARPNVTFDVFSLCLKSGNACVLKGGSDAEYSNKAIIKLIHEAVQKNDLEKDIACLLDTDREATAALLNAVNYVDIIIPRGSQGLINYVRENARVPVIETGAGIVHTYYDEFADREKGIQIINNAKTRRVSVCNALDCLVINKKRLEDLPDLVAELQKSDVELYADPAAYKVIKGKYPDALLHEAQPEHFGAEFLAYKMSVKTVDDLDEALDHIAQFSSRHSEAIISENEAHINKFLKGVDAAAVYANASTAFTDGAQFGLGAEIGISTQKLHARGPMGLQELTSYKWVVVGQGNIRA